MITKHNGFKLGDRVAWQGSAGTIVRFDPLGLVDVALVYFVMGTAQVSINWVSLADLTKIEQE